MPPKKKGGRKKEQPPLSVQGLLHLEASFVAPSDGGVTLATVTPGSCYGYGDGAGHVPTEEVQTEAGPQAGPHGDSPVTAAGPHGNSPVTAAGPAPPAVPAAPPPAPAVPPANPAAPPSAPAAPPSASEAPPPANPAAPPSAPAAPPSASEAPPPAAPDVPLSAPAVLPPTHDATPPAPAVPPTNVALFVPPPPPDMDDPDMYEPPEFAKEATTMDSDMGAAPTADTAANVTPVENGVREVQNETLSVPIGKVPEVSATRLAPQSGLASPTPAAGQTPVTADRGVIRAAPALRPPPEDLVTADPSDADPSGGCAAPITTPPPTTAGWHGAGQMSTEQLVAAAAAAADPAGRWSSGAQHPRAETAAPATAATATATSPAVTAAAAVTVAAPPAAPLADLLSEAVAAGDGLLQHYWQFVRENQYDFNGWTYLLQHVEKQTNLDAIRAVYNAFLPLYPYCFAYWKKYADLEQRSGYAERSLQILERAVKAIPLSVELWMALLNQFRDHVKGRPTGQQQTRELCERAVRSAGSQFRADALWECSIQWETTYGTLSAVTAIYRRLLKIPTRLYNRHWDNFLQHVRDYHPRDILEREEYLTLRRLCCTELNMPYREEPAFELPPPAKTQKPEVKLISAIKEKLVAEMVSVHEETERKAEKRWKLEEKIKRPYFHVIPLDRRQLRAWREYLELEATDGDHHSLVLLYERCLIACAQYEEFWVGYARYLERQLPAATDTIKTPATTTASTVSTASSASTAGCAVSAATAAVPAATPAPPAAPAAPAAGPGAVDDTAIQRLLAADQTGRRPGASYETESRRLPEERSDVAAGYTQLEDPADAVREVYKRACLVHCPTKPNVRMQWAAFEERVGHAGTAVQLLGQVLASFPSAVRPWLQQIGLERRRQNLAECSRLYSAAAAAAPDTLRTWWAMKHARFCFKVLSKPDKALGILRTAVKRDRSNARLYLHILDVCYQRDPVDVRGVTAALSLAISSKDLSARDKLGFRRKRVEFFEEFGSLSQLLSAEEELEIAERGLAAAERKQARQQEKEQERELQEQQEQEQKASAKAKRRSKVKMDPTPPPPMPDQQTENAEAAAAAESRLITACPKCGWDGSSDPAQPGSGAPTAAAATAPAEPPIPYDQVPPTWDLTMSTKAYGYGKDPQYKWFQERGYREYSDRVAGGYPASVLDPVSSDDEIPGSAQPPAKKRALLPDPGQTAGHIVTRDGRRVPKYVIRPQAPTLRLASRPVTQQLIQQPTDAPGQQEPQRRIPQLVRLPALPPLDSESACTNVPEWLVREGGELMLSETGNGMSRIRYWPHFMTDKGVQRMFHTLRRYVKWHQTRQVAADGRFVALKRLVAWFGPCGLEESGLMMPSNDSWSPELLDLLQRLCEFSGQEFNSCHLSLFRSGNDLHDWHGHDQPALGRHPTIAVVSLGATRSFEMRQTTGGLSRFLRFPLFPGSLLVMEGATQQDWLHQIPREARVKDERIGLQFRVMYDLKDAPGGIRPRLLRESLL